MVDVFGTESWNSALFSKRICVTVSFHCSDKYLSKTRYKEREFILAKVSEDSVHDCQASLQHPCSEAKQHENKRVFLSKICSPGKLGSRGKGAGRDRKSTHFPQ